MKNTCYTCNFYGKCQVQNKTCADWIPWDGETIVLNLEAFNGLWIGLHKKWFEKYPKQLLDKRFGQIKLYLAGETEHEIAVRLSNEIMEIIDGKEE